MSDWSLKGRAMYIFCIYFCIHFMYILLKHVFKILTIRVLPKRASLGRLSLVYWCFEISKHQANDASYDGRKDIYWWWLWLWCSRRLWLICDCDSRAHASSAPIGVGLIVRISIEWNRHVNVYSCESMVHIHIHMYIYNILFSIESLLLGSMYIWSLLNQLNRS